MAGIPWTATEMAVIRELYPLCPGKEQELLDRLPGRTWLAIRRVASVHRIAWGSKVNQPAPVVEKPASVSRSIEELLSDQAERFQQKELRHRSKQDGLNIRIPGDGPYALLAMGDVHAGDDGTDLGHLAYCCKLAKETEHLWAFHIGDMTNNWIGKLARLYAHQHTTDDEEAKLLDWILQAAPWLFVTLGNHDKWSPLAERACKQFNVPYVSHGAKWRITRGDCETVVDARHDHPGRSMYNPAHGQLKRNHRGSDADIIIGGHIHTSAYTVLKNGVTGKIGHAIRVGAFKRVDEYADQIGADDETISPCVLCLIDPTRGPEGRVTVFHDIDLGRLCLKAAREEYERNEEGLLD